MHFMLLIKQMEYIFSLHFIYQEGTSSSYLHQCDECVESKVIQK